MAEPPTEDRDRRTDEDLFEDLDQFFAPLEDDWPEGDQPDQPPGRDVTPAPTEPGVRAAEAGSEPEVDEAAGPAERAEAPGSAEEALADLDELAREEDWIAEATADMQPEASGLDEGGPEPAEPAEPVVGAPVGEEEAEPAAPPVPGGTLTPADLRTPPPAYADLPGPTDEGRPERRPAPDQDDILADEPTMDDLEMPLAFDDELLEEEPAAREPDADDVVQVTSEIPTGDLPVPEPPPEPEEEDVEAAAEHFAEGLRADDVERDLLSDLEGPTTTTAPIDRDAVLEQAAAGAEPSGGPVEPVEAGAETAGVVVPSDTGMGEGEAPPSWDDGAAEAATTTGMPEEGAPGPRVERNLVAAFVSGILLLAVAIALLAIGTGAFAFLAGAVILLAQGELYAVMRKGGYEPATLFGLAMGLLIVAAAYLKGVEAMVFALSLSMLLVVLWYMAAPPPARKGTLRDVGVTLLGIVYVPFLAGFAMLLLGATREGAPDIGRDIFLVVIGLTVLYDISAYAIGSLWGSRPLAPAISPRKSWEGAIGATFVLLLAALAIVPQIEPFEPGNAVGLALVIALAAPLGDLVESAFKRDLGVKDMSTLLPGHGGMLDRIDAILFAAPAAYWFLRIALT